MSPLRSLWEAVVVAFSDIWRQAGELNVAGIAVPTIITSFQDPEFPRHRMSLPLARGQALPSPEAIYTLRKYLSRAHTFTNGYIRMYTVFIR